MADTHGFDIVAEITQQGILDILQGGWVSGILQKNIPTLPGSVGGIGIQGGQVQVLISDVGLIPPGTGSTTPAGSLQITFDIQIGQLHLVAPTIPSISVLNFEAKVASVIPVGSKAGVQDVALLFDQISPANPNMVTLVPADPVQANLKQYITDFVHQEFHNGNFPATVKSSQNLNAYTCNATADLLDNPNDPTHQVQVNYPVVVAGQSQIQLIIPIHVRIDNIQKTVSFAPDLVPMMGIETQMIITTTDFTLSDGFISADLSKASVDVGMIMPAGSDYPNEGANFTANAGIINGFLGPGSFENLMKTNLITQGKNMLQTLPASLRPFMFTYPKSSDIQLFIAQTIHDSLVGIGPQEIFPGPNNLPPQATPKFVVPLVVADASALAICINTTSPAALDPTGMLNFVRAGDIFAIAISASKTIEMINQAKDAQFPTLPVVLNVDGQSVRLKSLNASLTSAIHFSGDLTAINAILGKWDVSASFDEDVGLEWLLPNSTLQNLKANPSDPDVHLSGLAWLVTILAGLITGGVAGVVVGAALLEIVQKIASNMGTPVVKDAVTNAVSGVGAWPSPISGFQLTVNSAYKKEIDISGDGLRFGG